MSNEENVPKTFVKDLSNEQETKDWVKNFTDKIVKESGKNWKNWTFDLRVPQGVFFQSQVFFITLKNADDQSKEDDVIKLVAKRPSTLQAMRDVLQSDLVFHNEIVFYDDYSKYLDNCPRAVYTEEKPPNDSAVVLEDLTPQGFVTYPFTLNTPLEYVIAAMKEVSRLHARGYVLKERKKEEFFKIVGKIREGRFLEDVEDDHKYSIFTNLTVPRPITYMQETGQETEFCKQLEPLLENAYDIIKETIKHDEPLATICHGDFTLSNVLFKKNDNDIEAKLIDFAFIRYASPAIDLSTFLYLYCSAEMRKEKLKDIFKAYHDSLIGYLEDEGLENLERFSHDAMYEDYKRKAIYSFGICCFFLPTLIGPPLLNFEDQINMDIRESTKILNKTGGDKVSQMLADMLVELRDFGCLDHFLKKL